MPSACAPHCNTLHTKQERAAGATHQKSAFGPDTRGARRWGNAEALPGDAAAEGWDPRAEGGTTATQNNEHSHYDSTSCLQGGRCQYAEAAQPIYRRDANGAQCARQIMSTY
jgi:hypothetical protein